MESFKNGNVKAFFGQFPSAGQARRAGPMTAALWPFLGAVSVFSALLWAAQSETNRSIRPMETDSCLMPRTHLPSHWFSWGQTRPEIAAGHWPRTEFRRQRQSRLQRSFQELGNGNAYRAAGYAGRIVALQAAAGFIDGLFRRVAQRYFQEVAFADVRRLFRHGRFGSLQVQIRIRHVGVFLPSGGKDVLPAL